MRIELIIGFSWWNIIRVHLDLADKLLFIIYLAFPIIFSSMSKGVQAVDENHIHPVERR